ncbi:MAG TPA: four helix bundle protein [Planctomycetota bacterium]|nr:four helix bundle protein [Planctomycetota bacterium]
MGYRIPSFKDLEVWRKAMGLVREIYAVTKAYPPDEKYGLTAETRKTARSIPANIAEGKMRTSGRDFRRFVSIALGSAGELQTQLLIAADQGYLPEAQVAARECDIQEIGRMLRGLEQALGDRSA